MALIPVPGPKRSAVAGPDPGPGPRRGHLSAVSPPAGALVAVRGGVASGPDRGPSRVRPGPVRRASPPRRPGARVRPVGRGVTMVIGGVSGVSSC